MFQNIKASNKIEGVVIVLNVASFVLCNFWNKINTAACFQPTCQIHALIHHVKNENTAWFDFTFYSKYQYS